MRKQHGVMFEAPVCSAHGKEMTLARFAVWRGRETWVNYEWYCPEDIYPAEIIDECCEVVQPDDGTYQVPQAVLDKYGDPSTDFVGHIDTTPVRLYRAGKDLTALLGGGDPPGQRGEEI